MTSSSANSADEQEIIDLEKQWNAAIQLQDAAEMPNFLADTYFLAIAIQGLPLQLVPRIGWLENLPFYQTESFTIDDMQVHAYGDFAVVSMLFTQKATVRGQDRSGQFMLTDIWTKQEVGWRIAERHSSRPEPQANSHP
jgi:ketosteroid isomerase-like protein